MKILLLTLWLLLSFDTVGQTLQQLQQQGNIDIKSWLEPAKNIATRQQVLLIIDIGTDTWFSGGTSIGRIDVENLLAIQRNKLATNYSERQSGVTRARQRWEITLYPLASGQFLIPPVAVKVAVAAQGRTTVSGTLLTKPLSFSASLPAAVLTPDRPWFVASNSTVSQTWNTEPAQLLKVGDAVVREITINASDTISALLPEFDGVAEQSDSGRYYLAPALLADTQPRGDYQASRQQKITFIVQQPRTYSAPDITIFWWNTTTQQLDTVQLPGQQFSVTHTPMSWLTYHAVELVVALLIGVLLIVLIVKARRYYAAHPLPAIIVFLKALSSGNYPRARQLIYRRLRHRTRQLTVTGYLQQQKKSDDLIAGWQSPWQGSDTSEQSTKQPAFFKIWTKITHKRTGFGLIKPALPELQQHQSQADISSFKKK